METIAAMLLMFLVTASKSLTKTNKQRTELLLGHVSEGSIMATEPPGTWAVHHGSRHE